MPAKIYHPHPTECYFPPSVFVWDMRARECTGNEKSSLVRYIGEDLTFSILSEFFRAMEENGGLEISTVEMHTGGEPLRIISSGYPEIKGDTILAKRRYFREHLDHIRKLVMFEPRGHYNMYGAVIVQPHSEKADLGVLFMHNEGYSTMCGHAVIALGRYAVDSGLLSTDVSRSSVGEVPVFMECPCGVVKALVDIEEGKSGRVRFVSVPAFAFGLDLEVDTERFGKVKVDIGFGGAFYAIVPGDRLGVDVRSSHVNDIIDVANVISSGVKSQIRLHHPDSEELAFLYGTIVTDGRDMYNGNPQEATANVCVFADSQVRTCIMQGSFASSVNNKYPLIYSSNIPPTIFDKFFPDGSLYKK